MIKLYEFALSGNCHKVRLMLSMLDLRYESVVLNGAANEQKSPEFLAMNPLGQVPVLVDGDVTVRDSQAILVYLASRYGGAVWWPQEPAALADISAWLSTAANEVAHGPSALRARHKFGRKINVEEATQTTATLLHMLEAQLSRHDWLTGASASIADVAIYPYLALAPEGQIDLAPYPALRAWFGRIQALPGYVGMPGM